MKVSSKSDSGRYITHARFCWQNAMTRRSVSGTKDNDLGKGGARFPGLLSKLSQLDILATK